MRNALRDLQMFVQGSRPSSRVRFPGTLTAATAILLAAAAGMGTAHAQTVTVTASAGAGGTITPSGAIVLPVGSNLTLTVTPDTGFHLNKLVVDGKNDSAAPSYAFENLTKNHKIAAKFKRNVYTVTASAADGFRIKPSGSLSLPYGKVKTFKIVPPAAGAIPYATVDGDPVALTPAGANFVFALTVTHDHVTAVSGFTPSLPVGVETSGTGTGTVTSDPAGIDCGETCDAVFPQGASVTLTAAAGDGSVFTEWSGACSGADPVCHLTVDAAVAVQAHFALVVVETGFLAEPRAEPSTGKAPLTVSLVPDADGSADPIAFYAWDDDGDGTWDSCDPDDPGNPAAPCDTEGAPREHLYGDIGAYHPTLLAQTTTGERSIGSALVTASGTTSEEKILDSLASGTIDEETALTYRIYADFGDPRLPAELVGDDPGPGAESGAMRELNARFDQLSPAAQDLLGPFLMPPAYEGSWYDLRTNGVRAGAAKTLLLSGRPVCAALTAGWTWAPSSDPSTKVRVWWDFVHSPGFAATAAHIASEVNTVIWPKEKALMNREPLADNIPATHGCDGGDGTLDIYLVAGVTVSGEETIGNCTIAAPGYIVARPTIEDGTTAHEVFHAFQDAYGLGACSANDPYRWYAESTAQWVMDHVYPSPQGNPGLEQFPAPQYLNSTELSLGDRTNTQRAYGAYVFSFFLARNWLPAWTRQIWEKMESGHVPPYDAIDAVLTGGLKDRWPEFARRAWNRAPFDQFSRWDLLAAGAKPQHDTPVSLAGATSATFEMPVVLKPLSIVYYRYTFPENAARTVTFYNGLTWDLAKGPMPLGMNIYGSGYSVTPRDALAKKGGSVQVLLKINGTWQPAMNLTDVPLITFCRDEKVERLEEAVFIFANSDKTTGRNLSEGDKPSALFATNMGCFEWSGSGDFVGQESGGTSRTNVHLRNLKFTRFRTPPPAPSSSLLVDPVFTFVTPFRLATGTADIVTSGIGDDGCSYDGSLHLDLPDSDTSKPLYLNLMTGLTGGLGYHNLQLAIEKFPLATYTVTICCPDPDGPPSCSDQTRFVASLLFFEPLVSTGMRMGLSGTRIEGDGQDARFSGDATGTWRLDSRREP